MSKLKFHMLTYIEVNFQKWVHFATESYMKLGSHTQSGHGLAQVGGTLKIIEVLEKKKKRQKKIHLPLIYIIQSAILNHTLSLSNEKIIKVVNTKDRLQLV